jgi:hypothetical protein
MGLVCWHAAAVAEPLPGAPPLPPAVETSLARAAASSGPAPRTRHRTESGAPLFTNRLALETSPYLRQHAHNPVSWHPWGPEAFAAAKSLARPILLSIGYSTCHWCHVMEEESFEDLAIAALINQSFIPIKVDREERPDIDALYMQAIQTLGHAGGWPMTVFLLPDGRPFYGGTYFPPRDAPERGMVGLMTLLPRVIALFREKPDQVERLSSALATEIRAALAPPPAADMAGAGDILRALADVRARYDSAHGGIGDRQKFPSSLPVGLLLRASRRTGDRELRDMVTKTLDAMRRGGIRDHVGGGFHRYTVEPTWTVPHFEKMLYDNALVVNMYLDAWLVTREAAFADVVRDTLDYVAREMTALEGTFYAATDADSDGEEGRYFVWTREELERAVGPALAALAMRAYGVDGAPTFEGGAHVLRRDASPEALAAASGETLEVTRGKLATIRRALLAARASRTPPQRDEKQIVGWNALMISAFARAGAALRDPALIERAERAASHVLARAVSEAGLARYLLDGRPHGRAVLDDGVYLAAAMLDLFEATGRPRWLAEALALQDRVDASFWDAKRGGYWLSGADTEALVARAKTGYDSALPSGNGVAALNLLRLHQLTGVETLRERAETVLRVFSDQIAEAPMATATLLEAVDYMLDAPREIVIVVTEGSDPRSAGVRLVDALATTYLPNTVRIIAAEAKIEALQTLVPWLDGKRARGDATTAYVCMNRTCQLPTTQPSVLLRQLDTPPRPYPAPRPPANAPAPDDAG